MASMDLSLIHNSPGQSVHKLVAYLLVLTVVQLVNAARDPDNSLDICITNKKSYQCGALGNFHSGFRKQRVSGYYDKYRDENLVSIDTKQIYVTDRTGRETSKLEVPGTYKLIFNKIDINRDLDYLVADLRIVISPNIGQESFEIFAMPHCDENSHLVKMDGTSFCRYCDLCDVTRKLEEDLILRNVFDPLQKTEEFDCRHLDNHETFRLSRTITLPNTDSFLAEYENKIDASVKKYLDNGSGKIVAHLRLLSKTAIDSPGTHGTKGSCLTDCINQKNTNSNGNRWSECRQNCEHDIAKNLSGSVSSACHASQSYMGGYQLAGCYDVEFNFNAYNTTRNVRCPSN